MEQQVLMQKVHITFCTMAPKAARKDMGLSLKKGFYFDKEGLGFQNRLR